MKHSMEKIIHRFRYKPAALATILVLPFTLNATRMDAQSIHLQPGRIIQKPGPPHHESTQISTRATVSRKPQRWTNGTAPEYTVFELENLRARGDRGSLQDCLVDFSDSSAIDFLPGDARYTFASAPFWYQECHEDAWVHIRPAVNNHYHLSYENPAAANCVPSAFADDGCNTIDPIQEPRTLDTHSGHERIRIMVFDSENERVPFDMKTLHITARPVRFCYKKVQEIEGPWITNGVDDETSPGTWHCWDNLSVGHWDVSEWVWDVVEVKIIGKNALSFGIDDIVLSVPPKDEPQWDWNVLDGPVPPGATTAVGDGSDERDLLQNVLNLAAPGDVIYFPSPPDVYGVAGNLTIDKPLTLLGNGWQSGSATTNGVFGGAELRQLDNGGTRLLEILSSDVLIDGLRLIGYEYGGANLNTFGIAAHALTPEQHYSNITVRNCWIQRYGGRGISMELAENVIIENNRVEDVTFTGIWFQSVDRGQIRANVVEDVGDPETGSPYRPEPEQDYAIAYPIVVASRGTEEFPHSTDIVIQDNVVRHDPVWTGIMNHGGHNIGIFDNEVYDCDFAYAVTWTDANGEDEYPPALASTRTWFINNYSENSPRNAQWFVGPREEGSSIDHAGIGNIYAGQTGPMLVWNQDGLVFSHNTFSGTMTDGADRAIRWGTENHQTGEGPILNVSRSENDLGGGIETFEFDPTYCGELAPEECILAPSSSVPSAPTNLKAIQTGQGVFLTWINTTGDGHDSFYIERSLDGVTGWTRVAFRPPDDGQWDFGSTNPKWQVFDPLLYLHRGAANGFYRIRAQNGEQASPWSDVVAVTP